MDKPQQSNLKKNHTVTTLLEEATDCSVITLTTKPNHLATVPYIFQNVPVTKEGSRLVINPGYLEIKGIGTKKNITVTEYKGETLIHGESNLNLVVENPKIISVSNLEITAIQAGNTILTVEKNGFSDSIRVDVKN